MLDVVIEARPTGVVARLARPDERPDLSVMSSAVGQDEDEAVERLRIGLDGIEPRVIRGHVVRPGDPDPPADGLPVFRFLNARPREDSSER